MAQQHRVQVRRIYDDVEAGEGARILVDRLWPRGVSTERARLDLWLREVAPSTELRKWYGHDPAKFAEFSRRYRAEFSVADRAAAYAQLRDLAQHGPVTLLTASKAVEISAAVVLQDMLGHGTEQHSVS